MTPRNELVLAGCRPVPLAHYLKALGILRLVSEQADPEARGSWRADRFVLETTLDHAGLTRFLLQEYQPTPIIAPWNGGGGFFFREGKRKEKDPLTGKLQKTGIRDQPTEATRTIERMLASQTERFSIYRDSIDAARLVLRDLGCQQAPKEEQKVRLVQALRNRLDDAAVEWLDCALLLTGHGAAYPPLVGTGGTEGNLDFTSNLMQRLLDLFDAESGEPRGQASAWLEAALFGVPADAYQTGSAIGQFLPGGAGGANATAGFEAKALINPWDFVLMLEGALLFASAAVRRMEHETHGALSYPFTVKHTGAGFGTAAVAEEASARGEIWMPLWGRPASVHELHAIMSEGRARVGRRPARTGLDFARALTALGVDRGIDEFQRYGFQVRNGLSYFATPLGRFHVRRREGADLLAEIDPWLERFRWCATGKNAPAAAGRALRRLQEAILELCLRDDAARREAVFLALGGCERMLARSLRWAIETNVHPVPPLSPEWLMRIDDRSAELRLAAAVASVGQTGSPGESRDALRRQLEPIKLWTSRHGRTKVAWLPEAGPDVVSSNGPLVDVFNAVFARRLLSPQREGGAAPARFRADLGDLSDFIEGRIDEERLRKLLWACLLVDWGRVTEPPVAHREPRREPMPVALYALLKLCFAGRAPDGAAIPAVPRIHRLAAAGRGDEAARAALRRLRGSGLPPALPSLHQRGPTSRRIAAALLFPLDRFDLRVLARQILRPSDREEDVLPSGSASDE